MLPFFTGYKKNRSFKKDMNKNTNPLILDIGFTGPTGPNGIVGYTGPIGLKGEKGIQGITGPSGKKGPQGVTGMKGEKGSTGLQGNVGPTGSLGEAGPTGLQGDNGIDGPTGSQGEIGPTGLQGEAGPYGPTGLQGEIGPIGPQGPMGASFSLSNTVKGINNITGNVKAPNDSLAILYPYSSINLTAGAWYIESSIKLTTGKDLLTASAYFSLSASSEFINEENCIFTTIPLNANNTFYYKLSGMFVVNEPTTIYTVISLFNCKDSDDSSMVQINFEKTPSFIARKMV
uniref:Collagen-like protein n=1 Tax=viral metagenome TaxID=1070528 RepID=A0A6C0JE10_9ZZZZ